MHRHNLTSTSPNLPLQLCAGTLVLSVARTGNLVGKDNDQDSALWVLAAIVLASIILYLLLAPWLFSVR